MGNFCIMRTQKLKTDGSVGASVHHALRTRETPNANKDLTSHNWCNWQGTPEENQKKAMASYRSKLPEKVRKNGVRAIELMMTFSPDSIKDKDKVAYLNACDDWAKKTFGEKNIFLVTHHYDEKTPHTSILLVPIDPKGNLNARHFIGGTRDRMSELQDDFAQEVGKTFNLERGIKGSRAKHETIKNFYAKVQKLDQAINPPKKHFFESEEKYKEKYKEQIAPLVAKSLGADQYKDRVEKLEKNWNEKLTTAIDKNLAAAVATETKRLNQENQKLKQENEKLKKEKNRLYNGIYKNAEFKNPQRQNKLVKAKKGFLDMAIECDTWRNFSPKQLHELAEEKEREQQRKRQNQETNYEW